MKCEECGKDFSTAEALEMHSKAKHPKEKKKPAIKKNHVIAAALVLVIAGAAFGAYTVISAPGPYDDFAKCLSDNGAIFYGAFWCPHCAEQKAMFGKSAKYLPYVECSLPDRSGQTQVCKDAGVESYPTWKFADGSDRTGTLSFTELASAAGCSPP